MSKQNCLDILETSTIQKLGSNPSCGVDKNKFTINLGTEATVKYLFILINRSILQIKLNLKVIN